MPSYTPRNRNLNDVVLTPGAITINTTTSTKIADANTSRIELTISNYSPNAVHIKEQAASIDDDKKGDILLGHGSHANTLPDNIYTGEYSAIAVDRPAIIYVTEK